MRLPVRRTECPVQVVLTAVYGAGCQLRVRVPLDLPDPHRHQEPSRMTSITSTTTLVMELVDVTGSTAYGPTIGPATRSDLQQ